MRKMMVVASREYKAAVKTKSFLITILVMPLLMGGSLIAQLLLQNVRSEDVKKFAVIDRTEGQKLLGVLKKEIDKYNRSRRASLKGSGAPFELVEVDPGPNDLEAIKKQRLSLSDQVREGNLSGILEIGSEVVVGAPVSKGDKPKPPTAEISIRYQSDRPTFKDFHQLAHRALTKAILETRATDQQVEHEKLEYINRPVPLLQWGLTRINPNGEIEDDSQWSQFVSMGVPVVLVLLMFMVIMIGATPLMQGVLEEKMQRIAEVLLGSVSPFQLMMGKLIGMTGVSLTIVLVYLGGGYWAASYFGIADYIPLGMLTWFFVYQVLAALLYGSLFIAIGAACTEIKETQNLLWPVMVIICIPMFVLSNILNEPNGPVATIVSFIPFATPMVMTVRTTIPPGIPLWQPLLGVVLTLGTTILTVYAAGRIFRVGLLTQGKGAKFSDMMRWIFRG